MTKTYTFDATLWLYPGKAAWHFITLPLDVAKDIDFYFAHQKRGWGSLPVQVTVAEVTWKTSIFPDSKTGSYLLPIKAEVRKRGGIGEKDSVSFTIELEG